MEARSMVHGGGRPGFMAGIGLITAFALPGQAAEWWIRGGPLYRGPMEVRVSGSSYTQDLGVHAVHPVVGYADRYDTRTYDDGYDSPDPGTANPGAVGGPGLTWNWGYDANPGQYDAAAQSLTFQALNTPGFERTLNSPFSASEDTGALGVEFVIGAPVSHGEKWLVDLGIGFQGTWGFDTDLSGSSYRERLGNMDYTDVFDVSGVTIPAGGHAGSYDGPFGTPPVIPSPVIPNVPANRTAALSPGAAWTGEAWNNVAFRVAVDNYQANLQPTVGYLLNHSITLRLTPVIGAQVVDVAVQRTETFSTAATGAAPNVLHTWTEGNNGTEVRFAAGLHLGADFELGKGCFFGVQAGYEWVNSDVDVQVGPNTVSVSPNAFVGSLVFGKRF